MKLRNFEEDFDDNFYQPNRKKIKIKKMKLDKPFAGKPKRNSGD